MKNWMYAPFADYLDAVDDLLEARYGVTADDTGMESIAAGQEQDWTPDQVAESLAGKYGLVRV